ncbi:MAG: cyclic pyranopterin monophosphate synthase MoaC [Planctomycetes bacterium]|nr:cyclic pyranopterin monophosphate synthase MoaC [Planctomycetota bacterium]
MAATRPITHLDAAGAPRMVDVGAKELTLRRATARARVRLSVAADRALLAGTLKKGGARDVVRLAAIGAAKQTANLIPLCHPLRLTKIDADLSRIARGEWVIDAEVVAVDRTGVEMEAMTAASVGALALYDMVKAVDRSAVIEQVVLLTKSGGKSGDYLRREARGAKRA